MGMLFAAAAQRSDAELSSTREYFASSTRCATRPGARSSGHTATTTAAAALVLAGRRGCGTPADPGGVVRGPARLAGDDRQAHPAASKSAASGHAAKFRRQRRAQYRARRRLRHPASLSSAIRTTCARRADDLPARPPQPADLHIMVAGGALDCHGCRTASTSARDGCDRGCARPHSGVRRDELLDRKWTRRQRLHGGDPRAAGDRRHYRAAEMGAVTEARCGRLGAGRTDGVGSTTPVRRRARRMLDDGPGTT